MSEIRAIIFDLDGVIIESEHLWTKADLRLLKNHGIDISPEDYEKRIKHILMGLGFYKGVPLLKKYFNLKGAVKDLISKRKLLVQEALEDAILVPGFAKFHKSIKTRFKTAVATSLVRYFLNSMILKFDLSKLFNHYIYSVEEIGFISKPNPDIYLYAAKNLGVKSNECVGIEDSPKGVEAVNRAGMKSVAITTTTARKKLSHANLIIDSFSEINPATLSAL